MPAEAAAPLLSGPLSSGPLPNVLAFERRGQAFCCPTADVLEIVEEPALADTGYPTPLVAGIVLHDGIFIPAVDPVCILDQPPERQGIAILLRGPDGRIVAVLADTVLGFRTPQSVAPAPWIPAGRICRAAAVLEGIGNAFILGGDGIGDVPAAPCPLAAPELKSASEADDGGAMHLVFTIAGRLYAAAYTDVERILYRQRPFRIPGGDAPLRYAVEVIGAVVPVLDLAEPAEAVQTAQFVVLRSPTGSLALRVDGVERPLPLTRDAAEQGWFPSPGIAGIGRMGERAYSVITGAALLQDLVGMDPS